MLNLDRPTEYNVWKPSSELKSKLESSKRTDEMPPKAKLRSVPTQINVPHHDNHYFGDWAFDRLYPSHIKLMLSSHNVRVFVDGSHAACAKQCHCTTDCFRLEPVDKLRAFMPQLDILLSQYDPTTEKNLETVLFSTQSSIMILLDFMDMLCDEQLREREIHASNPFQHGLKNYIQAREAAKSIGAHDLECVAQACVRGFCHDPKVKWKALSEDLLWLWGSEHEIDDIEMIKDRVLDLLCQAQVDTPVITAGVGEVLRGGNVGTLWEEFSEALKAAKLKKQTQVTGVLQKMEQATDVEVWKPEPWKQNIYDGVKDPERFRVNRIIQLHRVI